MTGAPNDVIVRLSKSETGEVGYEVLVGCNDDAMLPELQKAADFISKALDMLKKSGAELDYAKPIAFADMLAGSTPKILVPRH